MSTTAGRAASFVRDGVVYSSSAIVNGVNAITPHLAGAVDILVVRQPDGSLKSTPFYVRFGKYSSFRSKDRTVNIFVNGDGFHTESHCGSYGQAYFIAESTELYTDEDDVDVDFTGGMTSPSGYSSNEDDDAPFADQKMLESVRREVNKLQEEDHPCTSEGIDSMLDSLKKEAESSNHQQPRNESSFIRNHSIRKRTSGRVYSDGDDEEVTVSEMQPATEGNVSQNRALATLTSSKSCPSFKTAIDVENDVDDESQTNTSSHLTDDEYEQDMTFYSTAASPKGSASHNNSTTVYADLENRLHTDLAREDKGPYGQMLGMDVNYDYLGDADTSKPETIHSSQLDISLCGHLLNTDMSLSEAQQIFQAHKIDSEMFKERGIELMNDSRLMCRWNDVVYPWKEAAPVIVGYLAFGGQWSHLSDKQNCRIPSSSRQSKTDNGDQKVSSGWYLWPFGSRSSKAGIDRDDKNQSRVKKATKKVLSPTPEQLASLELTDGQNVISYRLGDSAQQEAYIYVISWSSRLVISDIDGTVTRSDLLGHLLPPIGVDWTHSGVAHLFSDIKANGYEIMFLSSRAIAQANITRDFLHRLEQEGIRMPVGPVIISPHGLLPSLYREMILRRPHDFKIGCLQDVRRLFPDNWNPFYAGFGNRETDVISYEESGVPPSRIFTINPRGQIIRGASSCIQTSTWSSLQGINELVHEVFPCYSEGMTTEVQREEFNEFQHWRISDLTMFEEDPELADLASFPRRSSSLARNLSR